MTNELLIALEIAQPERGKQALNIIRALPGIKAVQWSDNHAEKGDPEQKSQPDILLIDDHPERGTLFPRIQSIKRNFPQTCLFVISSNQDPQQIIKAMKAGVAEYLVEPLDDTALQGAIEEVRSKMAQEGRLVEGSIYSFISAKGGIGSTVLAVNTSAATAMDKKGSVALLDMSFQSGDASVLLDLVPKTTILDICRNFRRLDLAFLQGILIPHNSGLNFLAAPPDPEQSDEIEPKHVSRTLELVRKMYDRVFIDCSSMHLTASAVEAFKRSEKVFILSDMSLPSIRNTVRLSKVIRKLGIRSSNLEIIINRYIKNAPLSLQTAEKNFGQSAYWVVPNDFSDVVTSINQGEPLVQFKPNAVVAKNIHQFVKKIMNQLDDTEFRGIRSKFGRNL